MRFLRYISGKYLNKRLDFKVKIFNVLALGGAIVSLLFTVFHLLVTNPINAISCFSGVFLSLGLLQYVTRTKKYEPAYIITIVCVFLILFPTLFFTTGGYLYGFPSFFVFAIVFTIFMLEGKKALLLAAGEVVFYAALCVVYYNQTEDLYRIKAPEDAFAGTLIAFISVSIVLGVILFLHFRLYNEQQKQLAEQNAMLDNISQLKSELLGNVSHELKTPLTVISVHIQRAEKLFELAREGDEEKIRESFVLVQDEIKRMSRLVTNALRLAALQSANNGEYAVNPTDVLLTGLAAYTSLLEKNGNTLALEIPDDLPIVVCSADIIVQVLSNLLSNANSHTTGGIIRVSARGGEKMLTVTISDNGSGVPPELLGHVFERGVTGGSGNGLGLPICRDLIRYYGGDVSITSELGSGTSVSFTLPIFKQEEALV